MRNRPSAYELLAFAMGAISDLVLINNALAYGGGKLLNKYPVIWPIWLILILLCASVLEFQIWRARSIKADPNAPAATSTSRDSSGVRIPLAILLGAFTSHTILFIRDVIADPTSHNLWPLEYAFWGIVLAAPSFFGWSLARMYVKLNDRSEPG